MGNVTVYLHKSQQDYADLVATILDTSRSEVVDTMIRYIKENVDEEKIFEGYNKAKEAYDEKQEEEEEE